MSIAFLDEQIKRDGTHSRGAAVRSAHAPRQGRTVRVAGRRASNGSSRLQAVAPLVAFPATLSDAAALPAVPRSVPILRAGDHNRVAPTRPVKLRLTPRGRWVLGALLVVTALIVFSLGRFSAGADASGPPQRVTVNSGDTLWGIAEHAAPGADPRVEIAQIIDANHLAASAPLTPGAVLLVPRG